jgi:hypothetical protein
MPERPPSALKPDKSNNATHPRGRLTLCRSSTWSEAIATQPSRRPVRRTPALLLQVRRSSKQERRPRGRLGDRGGVPPTVLNSDRRRLVGGDCERGMRSRRGRRWTRPCIGTDRASATCSALLRLVRTGREVAVDEGGCSPTRARARCACRSSRIRPAASTSAAPAIAAKEGSRRGRSQRRTVEGVEMRTFGEDRGRERSHQRTFCSSSAVLPLAVEEQSGNRRG